MGRANKEQIKGAKDWDTKDVPVDGWGTIGIRSLSAKERMDLAADYGSDKITNDKACEFYCRLLQLAVIDDAGSPVFSDDDKAWLIGKNWNRLEYVANEIMAFNGMRDKEHKEAVKN